MNFNLGGFTRLVKFVATLDTNLGRLNKSVLNLNNKLKALNEKRWADHANSEREIGELSGRVKEISGTLELRAKYIDAKVEAKLSQHSSKMEKELSDVKRLKVELARLVARQKKRA